MLGTPSTGPTSAQRPRRLVHGFGSRLGRRDWVHFVVVLALTVVAGCGSADANLPLPQGPNVSSLVTMSDREVDWADLGRLAVSLHLERGEQHLRNHLSAIRFAALPRDVQHEQDQLRRRQTELAAHEFDVAAQAARELGDVPSELLALFRTAQTHRGASDWQRLFTRMDEVSEVSASKLWVDRLRADASNALAHWLVEYALASDKLDMRVGLSAIDRRRGCLIPGLCPVFDELVWLRRPVAVALRNALEPTVGEPGILRHAEALVQLGARWPAEPDAQAMHAQGIAELQSVAEARAGRCDIDLSEHGMFERRRTAPGVDRRTSEEIGATLQSLTADHAAKNHVLQLIDDHARLFGDGSAPWTQRTCSPEYAQRVRDVLASRELLRGEAANLQASREKEEVAYRKALVRDAPRLRRARKAWAHMVGNIDGAFEDPADAILRSTWPSKVTDWLTGESGVVQVRACLDDERRRADRRPQSPATLVFSPVAAIPAVATAASVPSPSILDVHPQSAAHLTFSVCDAFKARIVAVATAVESASAPSLGRCLQAANPPGLPAQATEQGIVLDLETWQAGVPGPLADAALADPEVWLTPPQALAGLPQDLHQRFAELTRLDDALRTAAQPPGTMPAEPNAHQESLLHARDGIVQKLAVACAQSEVCRNRPGLVANLAVRQVMASWRAAWWQRLAAIEQHRRGKLLELPPSPVVAFALAGLPLRAAITQGDALDVLQAQRADLALRRLGQGAEEATSEASETGGAMPNDKRAWQVWASQLRAGH